MNNKRQKGATQIKENMGLCKRQINSNRANQMENRNREPRHLRLDIPVFSSFQLQNICPNKILQILDPLITKNY